MFVDILYGVALCATVRVTGSLGLGRRHLVPSAPTIQHRAFTVTASSIDYVPGPRGGEEKASAEQSIGVNRQ